MTLNFVPRQYREVAVVSVSFPLTASALARYFGGREVYRRTRYVVVRNGSDTAIVALETAPGPPIMTAALGVTVLALPFECAFLVNPETDTGVPSSLVAAAQAAGVSSRAVVVEGRYHHINFVLDPAPVRIRVVDVVPPAPAKLVDQVARVLAVAEDRPPVEVIPDVIALGDLARLSPASRYLLPCRGSGFTGSGAEVSFLDERPPRQDWTLIGCARSRELHRWFYGDVPPAVDMCPRTLAAASSGGPPSAPALGDEFPALGDEVPAVTLTKCCLLEDRVDVAGRTVVVPWGASLAQIGQGLDEATRLYVAPGEETQGVAAAAQGPAS